MHDRRYVLSRRREGRHERTTIQRFAMLDQGERQLEQARQRAVRSDRMARRWYLAIMSVFGAFYLGALIYVLTR